DAAAQRREAGIEQRMAGAGDCPAAVVRNLGHPPGRDLSELDGRFSRVERGELLFDGEEVSRAIEHCAAEFGQQSLDLPPLLRPGERELVVGLDDLERLDENGLSRSGTVVD